MTINHSPYLFDAYLDFSSGANGLKTEIARDYVTVKACKTAKKLFAESSSDLSSEISLAARRLARKAYGEFAEKLKEKYKNPMYELPLNSYLRTTAGFFENALKSELNKEIENNMHEIKKIEENKEVEKSLNKIEDLTYDLHLDAANIQEEDVEQDSTFFPEEVIVPSRALSQAIFCNIPSVKILSVEEEVQISEVKKILPELIDDLKIKKDFYLKLLEATPNKNVEITMMVKKNAEDTPHPATLEDIERICKNLSDSVLEYIHFLSGKASKLLGAREFLRAKVEFGIALSYMIEVFGPNSLETLKIKLDNDICQLTSSSPGESDPTSIEKILEQLESYLKDPSCDFDTKKAIAIAHYNLAQYYLRINNTKSALHHLETSKRLRIEYGASEIELDRIRYLEGGIAYKNNETRRALKLLEQCYVFRKSQDEFGGNLIPVLEILIKLIGNSLKNLDKQMDFLTHLLQIKKQRGFSKREIIKTQLQLLNVAQYKISDEEYRNIMTDIENSLAEIPVTKESIDVAESYMELADIKMSNLLPHEWSNRKKRTYYFEILKFISKAESHLNAAKNREEIASLRNRLDNLKYKCRLRLHAFSDPSHGRLIGETLHPEDEEDLLAIENSATHETNTEEELKALSEFSTEARHSQVSWPENTLLTIEDFALLPSKGVINPYKLRTAQSGITLEFSDGKSIEETRQKLIEDPNYTKQIPPIQIGIHAGKVYSFDTRRLIVHQQAKEAQPNVFIRYEKIEGDVLQQRVAAIFSPRSWNGVVTALRFGGKGSESEPYINPPLRSQLEKVVQEEFKRFPSDRQGADVNGFPSKRSQAKKIYKFLVKKKNEDGSKWAEEIIKKRKEILDTQGREAACNYLIDLKAQISSPDYTSNRNSAEKANLAQDNNYQ